jgi:hypothetical protein
MARALGLARALHVPSLQRAQGFRSPATLDDYPTRGEVITYLERHAQTFELPIELNSEVEKFDQGDGRFRLAVGGLTIIADQVVVATGPFQTPHVPKLSEKLAGDLFQTHAVGYRKLGDVAKGTVRGRRRQHRLSDRERAFGDRTRSCSRSGRSKSRCRSACSGYSEASSSRHGFGIVSLRFLPGGIACSHSTCRPSGTPSVAVPTHSPAGPCWYGRSRAGPACGNVTRLGVSGGRRNASVCW